MEGKKHSLELHERTRLVVTGVTHLGNYNENEIVLETQMGALTLKGVNMNVTLLDLAQGELAVSGQVVAMIYDEGAGKRSRGLWQKILK